MLDKSSKVITLTRNKTRQFSLVLNDKLVELFKLACDKNNVKQTQLIEIWMIKYIEENDLL